MDEAAAEETLTADAEHVDAGAGDNQPSGSADVVLDVAYFGPPISAFAHAEQDVDYMFFVVDAGRLRSYYSSHTAPLLPPLLLANRPVHEAVWTARDPYAYRSLSRAQVRHAAELRADDVEGDGDEQDTSPCEEHARLLAASETKVWTPVLLNGSDTYLMRSEMVGPLAQVLDASLLPVPLGVGRPCTHGPRAACVCVCRSLPHRLSTSPWCPP